MQIKKYRGQTIRDISVDWNDLKDLEPLFNQVKSRYFELRRIRDKQPSKKQRNFEILEACHKIYSTDISHIYKTHDLDSTPVYYVYAHLDPNRHIMPGVNGKSSFAASLGLEYLPFYIGKGTGNRYLIFDRNGYHRKILDRLNNFGKKPLTKIIASHLTESAALQLESKLIDIFGLIPHGGMLANLDEGLFAESRRKIYHAELATINKLYRELHTSTQSNN